MLFSNREPSRRGCESFLRIIPSLNDLPIAMQEAIQQKQSTDSIRKILYLPPQQYPLRHNIGRFRVAFGWRHTPPRIVVFGADQITIVEGLEAQNTLCIPLADLLMIRLMTVLLYSYFELEWCSGTQSRMIRLEFNAVGEHLVDHELAEARKWIAANKALTATDPSHEFSFHHFPLKFYNYTFTSLLPDEQVWVGVYEPEIRASGRFPKGWLSPNRTIVITGQHLIVVSDPCLHEPSISKYRTDRWFCPRGQITGATVEAGSDVVWLNLSLGGAAYSLRLPLREANATQLQAVLDGWLIRDPLQVQAA